MFSLQLHDTVNVKKSKIKRGLIMCLRSSWRFVNARKNGGTYKRKSVWIFAKRGSNSTSQSSKQNFFKIILKTRLPVKLSGLQMGRRNSRKLVKLPTLSGIHLIYFPCLSMWSENHSKKLNVKNEPKEYGGEKRRCKQIL